jgi:UDP-N-acetylglucosamine 4,6-dehydratase/5-epimerase
VFNNKNILITGGTGSFGKKCVEIILKKYKPNKLIVFSRDELKQFEMEQTFSEKDTPVRYLLGDIRDKERLYRAFNGVDFIIHAAALKQVPAAERNPFEVIKTNILGAENIINAAIDNNVKKVIALSTDKAAGPINLYGATKLCSDKLFVAGNSYSGKQETRFSVVRYGNVVGSRGSVIPFFLKLRKTGVLPITDERMTRFFITLEQGVEFVLSSLEKTTGGELFVPKIPSMKITDLANIIAPECKQEIIGIRPGEKIHEVLLSDSDSRNAIEYSKFFIVKPEFKWWSTNKEFEEKGAPVSEGFSYSSDNNSDWLTENQLMEMVS